MPNLPAAFIRLRFPLSAFSHLLCPLPLSPPTATGWCAFTDNGVYFFPLGSARFVLRRHFFLSSLFFFFFRKNFQSEVENFLISHAKLYERIAVIHFWPILLRIGQRYTVLVSKIATSNSSGSSRASFVNINSNPDHIRRDTKRESPAFPHRN